MREILKKLLYGMVIFVLLIGNVAFAEEKDNENLLQLELDKYESITNSDEWKTMSYMEQINSIDTDIEICERLSTEDLFALAISYPLNLDFIMFDDIYDGFEHMRDTSNVFKCLMSRSDYKIVLDKFSEQFVCSMNLYGVNGREGSDVQNNNSVRDLLIKGMKREANTSILRENTVFARQNSILASTPSDGFVAESWPNISNLNDGARYIRGTYYKYGTSLSALQFESNDYSNNEITTFNTAFRYSHPSWVFLRNATKKYNCHAYAWITTSSSNIYWINDPTAFFSGNGVTYRGLNISNSYSNSRIVIYNNNGDLVHSVIASVTSSGSGTVRSRTSCVSKFAVAGLYQTTLQDAYDFYNGSNYRIYTIS